MHLDQKQLDEYLLGGSFLFRLRPLGVPSPVRATVLPSTVAGLRRSGGLPLLPSLFIEASARLAGYLPVRITGIADAETLVARIGSREVLIPSDAVFLDSLAAARSLLDQIPEALTRRMMAEAVDAGRADVEDGSFDILSEGHPLLPEEGKEAVRKGTFLSHGDTEALHGIVRKAAEDYAGDRLSRFFGAPRDGITVRVRECGAVPDGEWREMTADEFARYRAGKEGRPTGEALRRILGNTAAMFSEAAAGRKEFSLDGFQAEVTVPAETVVAVALDSVSSRLNYLMEEAFETTKRTRDSFRNCGLEDLYDDGLAEPLENQMFSVSKAYHVMDNLLETYIGDGISPGFLQALAAAEETLGEDGHQGLARFAGDVRRFLEGDADRSALFDVTLPAVCPAARLGDVFGTDREEFLSRHPDRAIREQLDLTGRYEGCFHDEARPAADFIVAEDPYDATRLRKAYCKMVDEKLEALSSYGGGFRTVSVGGVGHYVTGKELTLISSGTGCHLSRTDGKGRDYVVYDAARGLTVTRPFEAVLKDRLASGEKEAEKERAGRARQRTEDVRTSNGRKN